MAKQTELNGFQHLLRFCGATVINHYIGEEDAPLVIGKQRFSYVEIARRTGMPGGKAARLISAIANAGHSATSLRDFYNKSSPSSLAVRGFGASSILMVFRLFESEGLDVERWARRGPRWKDKEGEDNFSTWATYKKRELAADQKTATTLVAGPRERGYRKVALREQQKADREAGI